MLGAIPCVSVQGIMLPRYIATHKFQISEFLGGVVYSLFAVIWGFLYYQSHRSNISKGC